MTSEFYNLRRDKLIRPAPEQPREQPDGWRDDMPDFSWLNNPAIEPKTKTTKPNIAYVTRNPKASPTVCKSCHDKGKPIHKQGYCLECYRAYRNKIQKGNRDKRRAAANPDRICKKCDQPAVSYSGVRLCRFHLNEYQRDLAAKRIQDHETDVIKETHQARRKALLEQKWQEKLQEYGRET